MAMAEVSQVSFDLPPHLLAALVPLLVLLVALDVYCLVDLARARSMRGPAKLAWILCGATYLAFAVAVTALVASMVRSTLATAGVTLAVLLLLPIAGTLRAINNWLPTTLATAPIDLLDGTHQLSHYLPAFAVAVAVSAAALAIADLRLRTRDI
jgi:hypothetical protein